MENRPYFTEIKKYLNYRLKWRWRWRFVAPNGRVMANHHGFNSLHACKENIDTVSRKFPGEVRFTVSKARVTEKTNRKK